MGAFLPSFFDSGLGFEIILFCMIRREYHPSSRIDALILKKKLEEGAKVGRNKRG